MLPIYLRLTNFLSHKESELRFDELDYITLIIGINRGDPKSSNGCGKSTLYDALTWALFEQCRIKHNKNTGLDYVVRNGAEKAEVEFHFKLGEALYRVVRSRNKKRGKSDVKFQIKAKTKWENVASDTKSNTNKTIIEKIGIGYDVFVKSCLLEQHDASGFATMKPGERKELISNILQLDYYEQYRQFVKNELDKLDRRCIESDAYIDTNPDVEQKKAEASKDLRHCQRMIDLQGENIKAIDGAIDKIRSKITAEDKIISARDQTLKRFEELQVRTKTVSGTLQQLFRDIDEWKKQKVTLEQTAKDKKNKLEDLINNRGDPGSIKRRLENQRSIVKDFTEKHTELTVKIKTITSEAKKIRNEQQRIQELNEGDCPTCYQKVTIQSKDVVAKDLETRFSGVTKALQNRKLELQDLENCKIKAEVELLSIEKEKDKYNNSVHQAKQLKTEYTSAMQQLEGVKHLLEDARHRQQVHNEELTAAQAEIAELVDKVNEVKKVSGNKLERLQLEIEEQNREREMATKILNQLLTKQGVLQERIKAQDTVLKKIAEIKADRKKIDHDRRIYVELERAFGKAGIQTLILENSVIEIEKIANNLLEKLTDGRVSIHLVTQREKRDGSLTETFDVIITDEFHSSPFNLHSGGEKFRIAFAIRIALSTILARRSGVKVSAIFYDEAFTDLDQDGIEKLMEVFTILSEDFRHQLIITHQTELKSQFNDVVTVVKSSDGSAIST